jgi:copper(I)-binding protein
LLTVAPLTAACGAGLNAETLREGTTIDGANAQTGDLRVRNAYLAAPNGLEFPAGTDIPIYLTVANIGPRADTLTEASSPLGQILVQPPRAASLQPGPLPSPTPATSSAPVDLPVGQAVSFGGSGGQMVLRQTTRTLRTASFVPITLRFAQSDQLTIQAPVGSGYGAGAGASSSAEPAPSGS